MYEEYIKQLHIEAKLRNLADSSIKTYTDFILRFLEYTGKDPQDISAQDVRDFLLFKQEIIAATTLNHYNSAIHFFFRRVLHKPWDDDQIQSNIFLVVWFRSSRFGSRILRLL